LTIFHDATNHSQPLDVAISGEGVDIRTKTFVYTGSNQTWTVPAGVTQARVLFVGSGGAGGWNGGGCGGTFNGTQQYGCGGGSSFTHFDKALRPSHEQGIHTGNGKIKLTY